MQVPVPKTLARLPLAEAVLTLWRWAADADEVNQIFDENRGKCYQKIFLFSTIVGLARDALLEYGGSGKQSFEAAQDRGELDASVRAAYGKLGGPRSPSARPFWPGVPQAQRHLPQQSHGPDPSAHELG